MGRLSWCVQNISQRAMLECEPLQGRGDFVEISDWREKIDELDVQIVRLISQRAEAARAIGSTMSAPRTLAHWETQSCCMCTSELST
jgi:hypothetical protein